MKKLAAVLFILSIATSFAVDIAPTSQDYGLIDQDPGSTDVLRPAYQWIDILGTGTAVTEKDANVSSNNAGIGQPVELPYPFPFYGKDYTQIVPCTNGYLSFDEAETGQDNTPQCAPAAPAAGKGPRIYAMHGTVSTDSGVYFQYFEKSPHPYRSCGVSVFTWSYTSFNGGIYKGAFQTLLFDNGDILMQYEAGGTGNPTPTTIGLLNQKVSAEGIDFVCDGSPPTLHGRSILFRAPMVSVSNGSQIASAIAGLRNGGKLSFANIDPSITTNDLVVPSTIVINKAVCIDADGQNLGAQRLKQMELDGNQERQIFDVGSNGRLLFIGGGLKNARGTSGGAIVVNGGSLKVTGSDLHHNRATTANGGAVIVQSGGEAQFHFCNFWKNSAKSSGGALFTQADGLVINSCSFFDNHAETNGGAVQIDVANNSSSITNSTFTQNTAGQDGAAISILESQATIIFSTIADNGAIGESTIYSDESDLTIGHNIFGANDGPSYAKRANFSSTTSLGDNIDEDNTLGLNALNDIINVDPLLSPLGLHGGDVLTMYPLIDSPAVDGGQSASSYAPLIDARGFPRRTDSDKTGGVIQDIGAVESGVIVEITTAADEYNAPTSTPALALREAIAMAPNGSRIVVDDSLTGDDIILQAANPGDLHYLQVDQKALFFDGSNLSTPPNIRGFNPSLQLFYHADIGGTHSLSFHSVTLEQGIDLKIANLYNCDAAAVRSTFLGLVDSSTSSINTAFARIENTDLATARIGTGEWLGHSSRLPRIADIKNTTGHFEVRSPNVDILNATVESDSLEFDAEYATLSNVHGSGSLSTATFGTTQDFTYRGVDAELIQLIGGGGGLTILTENLRLTNSILANKSDDASLILAASVEGLVTNFTVSGNRSTRDYCQVAAESPFVVQGALTLDHCTIYDNSLTLVPAGIDCPIPPETSGALSGFCILKNTILARNRVINEVFNTSKVANLIANSGMTSLGNNLIDTVELTESGIAQPTDREGEAPFLFPLRDNGGPFPTHQPMAASSAIDGGISGPSTPEADARGYLRDVRGRVSLAGPSRPDIGAVEATAPFVVSYISGDGDTELRQKLSEDQPAGHEAFPKRIVFLQFDSSTPQLPISSTLNVNKNTTIDASQLEHGIILDGQDARRHMALSSDTIVNIAGVTFRHGFDAGDGASCLNSADLLLSNCAFIDNNADGGGGAILMSNSGASLDARNCTFSNNSAGNEGAALSHVTPASAISFRHCTFAGNISGTGEAAIYNGAQMTTLYANLFSNNTPNDYESSGGGLTNLGYNLTDRSTSFPDPQPTDILNAQPDLDPVTSKSGISETHALLENSDAIDAGPDLLALENDPSLLDARGFVRQLLTPNGLLDIGSYETNSQDSDGDQMTDDWEIANALDPNNPSDAADDNDFDGLTNLEEFQGGTLAWDNYNQNIEPDPVPDFLPDGNGGWTLQWISIPLSPPTQYPVFYTYQVECSTDLVTWLPYSAPFAGIDGILTSAIAIGNGDKFFRVHFQINLSGQDLSGADLSNLDLSGADFSNADLTGSNLSGSDLTGADLSGTILTDADLSGAELSAVTGNLNFPAFNGAPGDPVETSLTAFFPEYSEDHFSTGFGGNNNAEVSHNTVTLSFADGVTVSQANAVLSSVNATIIGALPAANPGEAAGFCLRLPSVNHIEFAPLLATLESSPHVLVVAPEFTIENTAVPTGVARGWDSWDPSSRVDGNWGMKYVRAPQLWNFNGAITKRLRNGEANRTTPIGIIDSQFDYTHPDLRSIPATVNRTPSHVYEKQINHGNHVTGIIAATHRNGGVDGVTPFVNIDAVLFSTPSPTGKDWAFSRIGSLVLRFNNHPTIKVVNMSQGYSKDIADGDTELRDMMSSYASWFQRLWNPAGSPIIVDSAGNSKADAKYGDPVAYSAIGDGVPGIFVVEAIDSSFNRWASASEPNIGSNFNGNFSAPGAGILSTMQNGYDKLSGTSMAAPHVTGTIAYLFSLKPNLSNDQIAQLLYSNTNPLGLGHGLDAWAAAMDIDRIAGGDEILRMLCDFDDGSLDGNERLIYKVDVSADMENEDPTIPGSQLPSTFGDVDSDGGIGDGSIDMSDFRRFRDWASISTEIAATQSIPAGLNGPVDHFKNDANRDKKVDNFEHHYPRQDLNGDGDGSWNEVLKHVPGHINADATDLEVLETLFEDPYYDGFKLFDLKGDSADINLCFYWFVQADVDVVGSINVRVRESGSSTNTFYRLVDVPEQNLESAHLVLTFETGKSYEVAVWGEVYGEDESTLTVGEEWTFNFDTPLEDHWFSPRAFDGFDPDE